MRAVQNVTALRRSVLGGTKAHVDSR